MVEISSSGSGEGPGEQSPGLLYNMTFKSDVGVLSYKDPAVRPGKAGQKGWKDAMTS